MSLDASVYVGVWTDWNTTSKTLGATLTLPSRDGNYLISAATVFLTIVEGSLWRILCRVAFRSRSRAQKDALGHQQQAILKNSTSGMSALIRLGLLTSAWRSKIDNAVSRSAVLMAMAFANLALFTTAGIFSSRIAPIHSNVLLEPYQYCGAWNYTNAYDATARTRQATIATRAIAMLTHNVAASQAIVSCARGVRNAQQCSPIGKPLLPYSSWCTASDGSCLNPSEEALANITQLDSMSYSQHDEFNGSTGLWTDYCPFDKEMCMNGTFTLDSGLIDSYLHLGINSPDTIQYRDVLTCTPLNTSNPYSSTSRINNTADESELGEEIWEYWYGNGYGDEGNYTFWHGSPSNYTTPLNGLIGPPFQLEMVDSVVSRDVRTFDPIPALQRTPWNTVLLFMQKTVTYNSDVTDPWFLNNKNDNVGVLGCLDRRLICNGENNCIPLSTNVSNMSSELQLNQGQTAILKRLSINIDAARFMVPNIVQHDSFLANDLAVYHSVLNLPNNQWQKELENWFLVGLTHLQLQSAQYVTSLNGLLNDTYRITPGADDSWMCFSQTIVRDDYTSFSSFGIAIIVLVGSLIIMLSFVINPIIAAMNAWFLNDTNDTLEWETDGLLQLQRLAYENGGMGHWSTGKHEVPLTHYQTRFGLPLHTESSQLKKKNAGMDMAATSTRSLTQSMELSRVSLLDVTKGNSRVVTLEDDDTSWRAV